MLLVVIKVVIINNAVMVCLDINGSLEVLKWSVLAQDFSIYFLLVERLVMFFIQISLTPHAQVAFINILIYGRALHYILNIFIFFSVAQIFKSNLLMIQLLVISFTINTQIPLFYLLLVGAIFIFSHVKLKVLERISLLRELVCTWVDIVFYLLLIV
jgi:hypothetical protein